jgi:hypothetical protein
MKGVSENTSLVAKSLPRERSNCSMKAVPVDGIETISEEVILPSETVESF